MADGDKKRVSWCRQCVFCGKCPCVYKYGCSICRNIRERKEDK